jgi:hypothetical protein
MHTIDMLTTLSYNASTKECYMKTCTKCKEQKDLSLFSKDKHQKSGYKCACKSCSALVFATFMASEGYVRRQKKAAATRKHEKENDPVSRWAAIAIGNARRRAKEIGLPCTITKAWLVNAAVTHCPLLEVPLDYAATVSCATSASVDRIDSTQGYVPGNCKVISFKANRIKSNATYEEVLRVATNLRNY